MTKKTPKSKAAKNLSPKVSPKTASKVTGGRPKVDPKGP